MKSVKLIFIAMEIVMAMGVIMLVFLTDWQHVAECGSDWMYKTMIVLCALNGIVMQKEQQSIEWNEED